MSERIWNRTLLLTAIAVAAISALSIWVAWQTSADLAARLISLALIPVVLAAVASYSLRILRFHYFLRHSGVEIPLRGTAIVQAIGFALSVTPAHVGELFKLHLIRERSGTPVVQTAPLLLLDRLTEGGGFMILAAWSALALPALRARTPMPVVMLAGFVAMIAFALFKRRWRVRTLTVPAQIQRAPLVQRVVPYAAGLWRGLDGSFTPRQILGGLALSATARFADGLVILFAARLMGLELALPVAVFILAVSGLAGGISLLPAGTGAVETTMVGLLAFSGITWQNALAITLLARLSTLWMWVALGLVLAFVLQLRLRARAAVTSNIANH